ncbi:MAG: DUF4190 domain-containing protein [Lachnospiraceae bacterium]|nr:DUF4190 domain-containing protein [Lachnospiraceae bacterium]
MDYNNQGPVYHTVPTMYMPAQNENPNNGMAVGALVCGIISIVTCLCCGIGAILSVIGIILAIASKSKNGGRLSGVAVGGLVCSIIGFLFNIGYVIYYIFVVGIAFTESAGGMQYYY